MANYYLVIKWNSDSQLWGRDAISLRISCPYHVCIGHEVDPSGFSLRSLAAGCLSGFETSGLVQHSFGQLIATQIHPPITNNFLTSKFCQQSALSDNPDLYHICVYTAHNPSNGLLLFRLPDNRMQLQHTVYDSPFLSHQTGTTRKAINPFWDWPHSFLILSMWHRKFDPVHQGSIAQQVNSLFTVEPSYISKSHEK